ncbi:MAG: hypothetical protein ACK557_01760, partial [Planctomycetota bacterium]
YAPRSRHACPPASRCCCPEAAGSGEEKVSAFVLAAASMTAVSLRSLQFNPNLTTPRANPLQAGGRILLRHCGGIVPPLFSSNRLDYASHRLRRLRILRKPFGDFLP